MIGANGAKPLRPWDAAVAMRGPSKDHKAWDAFNRAPLALAYFASWCHHLNQMFRAEVDDGQMEALFEELKNRSFTNGDMSLAGEYALTKLRRWPYLADLLECPDIEKNMAKRR